MFRVTEYDGMRGLLAWWVVAYHILCNSGYSESSELNIVFRFLQHGGWPVDVFIILSGFAIVYLLEHRRERYKVFILRRFFRLFPVYILCFTLAVIISGMVVENLQSLAWSSDSYIARLKQEQEYIWQHISAHALMFHGILPNEVLPNSTNAFLAPAWSTSLEWQFYLVAPLAFLFLKRSPVYFLIIAGCATLLGKCVHIVGHYPNPGFLPLRVELFWVGGISFYLLRFVLNHEDVLYSMKSYLVITTVILVVVFTRSIPLLVWSVIFGIVLIKYNDASDKTTSAITKILNFKYLQKLGHISYSTYLSHLPIIYICQWLILKIFPEISKKGMLIILSLSTVPTVIIVSLLLFRTIEEPSINLGTRLAKKI